MNRISTIVTDLDDTLWDWVGLWYASYKPFFEKIAEISGLSLDCVLDSVKRANQKHGTSEYTFLLQEMDVLQTEEGEDVCATYSEAIDVFREARRKNVCLYPGVRHALKRLKAAGCLVAAYTDSHEFETRYRLVKTGADEYLDYLYLPAEHVPPQGVDVDKLRAEAKGNYALRNTIVKHTPAGSRKPDDKVLRQILEELGASKGSSLYIGDKLPKDVLMAQRAQVLDVWAKYGCSHQREEEYSLLRRVTHWSGGEVERERQTTEEDIEPTITCDSAFADFLEHVTLERFRHRTSATTHTFGKPLPNHPDLET